MEEVLKEYRVRYLSKSNVKWKEVNVRAASRSGAKQIVLDSIEDVISDTIFPEFVGNVKPLNKYRVSYCPISCPSIRMEVYVLAYSSVEAEIIVENKTGGDVVGSSIVVTFVCNAE